MLYSTFLKIKKNAKREMRNLKLHQNLKLNPLYSQERIAQNL